MHVAIDHAFILLFKVGEVADVYQVVNEDEYSDIMSVSDRKRTGSLMMVRSFARKLQSQALTAKVHSYHFTSATL